MKKGFKLLIGLLFLVVSCGEVETGGSTITDLGGKEDECSVITGIKLSQNFGGTYKNELDAFKYDGKTVTLDCNTEFSVDDTKYYLEFISSTTRAIENVNSKIIIKGSGTLKIFEKGSKKLSATIKIEKTETKDAINSDEQGKRKLDVLLTQIDAFLRDSGSAETTKTFDVPAVKRVAAIILVFELKDSTKQAFISKDGKITIDKSKLMNVESIKVTFKEYFDDSSDIDLLEAAKTGKKAMVHYKDIVQTSKEKFFIVKTVGVENKEISIDIKNSSDKRFTYTVPKDTNMVTIELKDEKSLENLKATMDDKELKVGTTEEIALNGPVTEKKVKVSADKKGAKEKLYNNQEFTIIIIVEE